MWLLFLNQRGCSCYKQNENNDEQADLEGNLWNRNTKYPRDVVVVQRFKGELGADKEKDYTKTE